MKKSKKYPNCPKNCPPRENKEKKNSKNPKKVFFAFFKGPHKFVENRQINRKVQNIQEVNNIL